jgi:hypothetical protein
MRSLLALPAVAAVLVVAAAASGGGNHTAATTTAPATTTTAVRPGAAEISRNWTRFFSPSTPVAEKVKLLQNGPQFAAAIRAASRSPQAKKLSVKVLRATPKTPQHADVVYDLSLGGKPLLVHQNGVAIRTHGVWQVGEETFCKLAALQGTKLPPCTKMTP